MAAYWSLALFMPVTMSVYWIWWRDENSKQCSNSLSTNWQQNNYGIPVRYSSVDCRVEEQNVCTHCLLTYCHKSAVNSDNLIDCLGTRNMPYVCLKIAPPLALSLNAHEVILVIFGRWYVDDYIFIALMLLIYVLVVGRHRACWKYVPVIPKVSFQNKCRPIGPGPSESRDEA